MSKFTLQLSKFYWRPQFFQTVSRRLQMLTQKSVKHLRGSVLAIYYFRQTLQS